MVIETQVFLNYFLEDAIDPLLTDGIQGNRTNTAIKQAITKLKSKFTKHGFEWNNSFNFIGIRTNNKITNRYDDWFVVYASGTLSAIPASTKAGSPAILKYAQRWLRGVKGFGTIVENQQIDYLVVHPELRNHWNVNWTGGLGFLFQDTTFRVYRDQNTDNIIDRDVVINSSGDGFNVHSWAGSRSAWNRAAIVNTRAKSLNMTNAVNNMSEGCQVTTADYWVWLFPQLRRNSKNNRIRYTLLEF